VAHLEGLAAHGVTPHHRQSFIPVRQLSLDFNAGGAPDIAALAALLDAAPPADELHDDELQGDDDTFR
jgi:hypothetical protein